MNGNCGLLSAKRCLSALALLLALTALVPQSRAQFGLTNANSFALLDPNSQAGMYNWSVLTGPNVYQNQLFQQWFWYRIGSNPEASIDTISAPTVTVIDPATLITSYSGLGFTLSVKYSLQGSTPASGQADISEQIKIVNTSTNPIPFHFFQYSDFDLSGTIGGDTVQLQFGPNQYFVATQTDGPPFNLTESQTVDTPPANHGEVGLFPNTLNKLNDGNPDNLSDSLGPITGDATWALQWDFNLGEAGSPTDSFQISKDKRIDVAFVPEPSSFALLGLGVLALARSRKRA